MRTANGAARVQLTRPSPLLCLECDAVVMVSRGATCFTSAVEQDEIVKHNLDASMAFARQGIFPAERVQPACHLHTAAFAHVLGTELAQGAPGHAAGPLDHFLHLAIRILPVSTGGDAGGGPGGAGGGVRYRGSWPKWPMSCTRLKSLMVVPPRDA